MGPPGLARQVHALRHFVAWRHPRVSLSECNDHFVRPVVYEVGRSPAAETRMQSCMRVTCAGRFCGGTQGGWHSMYLTSSCPVTTDMRHACKAHALRSLLMLQLLRIEGWPSVPVQDEHVAIAALADAPLAWPCPAWLRGGSTAGLEGAAQAAPAPAPVASSPEEASSDCSGSSGSSGGAACNGRAAPAGGGKQETGHAGSSSSSGDSASAAPGVLGSGSTSDSSDSASSAAADPAPSSDEHEQLDALLSAGGPRARTQALLLLERRRQDTASRAGTLDLRCSAGAGAPARAAVSSDAPSAPSAKRAHADPKPLDPAAHGNIYSGGAAGAPPARRRCVDLDALNPASGGCGNSRGGALGAAGRPACSEGLGLGSGPGQAEPGRRASGQGGERRAAARNPLFVVRGAALEPVEAVKQSPGAGQCGAGAPQSCVLWLIGSAGTSAAARKCFFFAIPCHSMPWNHFSTSQNCE